MSFMAASDRGVPAQQVRIDLSEHRHEPGPEFSGPTLIGHGTMLRVGAIGQLAVSRRRPVDISATSRAAMASASAARADTPQLGKQSPGVGEDLDRFAGGWGSESPAEVVRAGMIIRAHQFGVRASGLSPEAADVWMEFINSGLIPSVPAVWSGAAESDRIPLAHCVRAVSGEGWIVDELGDRVPASDAMRLAGVRPYSMRASDRALLMQGCAFTLACGSLATVRAMRLVDAAERAITHACRLLSGQHEVTGAAGGMALARAQIESVRARIEAELNDPADTSPASAARVIEGALGRLASLAERLIGMLAERDNTDVALASARMTAGAILADMTGHTFGRDTTLSPATRALAQTDCLAALLAVLTIATGDEPLGKSCSLRDGIERVAARLIGPLPA